MRVMIWADIEGVAGVSSWEHTGGTLPLYDEGRRLYSDEVSAAVRGCKEAGATDITVVDGHGGGYRGGRGFMSLMPERLERGARYVLGYRWARYVEPFEKGCDAVLFVGAHAMAGTPDGVLCHTVSSEAWYNATINSRHVGESGIVAAIAGCWGTPSIFVSGDDATCREVQALCGETVVTAAVKTGLGRYSASHLCGAEACDLIEAGAARALSNRSAWPKPLAFGSPVTFEVEVASPDHAVFYEGRTGVEIVDPRRVRATADTFWHAWDAFWYKT